MHEQRMSELVRSARDRAEDWMLTVERDSSLTTAGREVALDDSTLFALLADALQAAERERDEALEFQTLHFPAALERLAEAERRESAVREECDSVRVAFRVRAEQEARATAALAESESREGQLRDALAWIADAGGDPADALATLQRCIARANNALADSGSSQEGGA